MRPFIVISAIALYIIVFSSCSKDDLFTLEPDSIYTKRGLERTEAIRVFANAGEVTTPNIVNRFIENDSLWMNDIGQNLYSNPDLYSNVWIVDDQNALIFNDNIYSDYSVKAAKTIMTFTGKDTLRATSYGDLFTRSISYNISLYKPPVYSEYIKSSTRGAYYFGYTGRSQFLLEKRDGKLRAPWIALIVHEANGVTNQVTVQNKPDYNFYHSIPAADTVVLREYSVIYDK